MQDERFKVINKTISTKEFLIQGIYHFDILVAIRDEIGISINSKFVDTNDELFNFKFEKYLDKNHSKDMIYYLDPEDFNFYVEGYKILQNIEF